MELLQVAEVVLDLHAGLQQSDVLKSGDLLHVAPGAGEKPSLVLDEEFPFERGRHVPGVSHECASEVLVHGLQGFPVAGIAGGEIESDDPAVEIDGKMKL